MCYKNISPEAVQFVGGVGKVSGEAGSFGRRGQQQGQDSEQEGKIQLRTREKAIERKNDLGHTKKEGKHNWIKILE